MRPIAHARRLSFRAAWFRHAVDAVVVGKPALAQFTRRVLEGNANSSQSRDDFCSNRRLAVCSRRDRTGLH
jgi:hypothetical protein